MTSTEKYWPQLKALEERFYAYEKALSATICAVSSGICRTVITKGKIANHTPYYYERMGDKLNGKILQEPIISDSCTKYHYDHTGRIIMVEEYSVFLRRFEVVEIYLYNHDPAERLLLSNGHLALLTALDHPFSNTNLSLSFSTRVNHIVEEFEYDGEVLFQITTSRDYSPYDKTVNCQNNATEQHRFLYEGNTLAQIERICPNGYRELLYTTKKPNFTKIKEGIYSRIKELIQNEQTNFASFGIECFLDQLQPMLYVCFTEDSRPDELIADWQVEMHVVQIYDWQLTDSQEKNCAKIIAEIIVNLADEGLLKDKRIYFHQDQVCVSQLFAGVQSVFKKADLTVQ